MLLKNLIKECGNFGDAEISGITCDSRKVTAGSAFVCIVGAKSDGHDYAETACKQGAAVIFAERDTGCKNQVIVPDTHRCFAELSANWFGRPAEKMRLIGITGTNGKTSTTYMIKAALEAAGRKVGLIGTIQHSVGERVIESHNTTPSAYELQELLAQMAAAGCEDVVMEVSSHALAQDRVFGLRFAVAVFTNLTPDHLDYHRTMEEYLAAKKKLFLMCDVALVNTDDEYAEELMRDLPCKTVTYSTTDFSDYSAKGIQYRPTGVDYELVGDGMIQHIKVHTGGKFSVYNSMAAAVTCILAGLSPQTVATAIGALAGVKGRAEVVPCDADFTVIIDYAHTPDGLKNILCTFRDCPKNRLIVVFGCGGDRDRQKRPQMGMIAMRYADYAVITSDNPRSEDPQAIIDDILQGIVSTNTPYKVVVNRVEAIRYALSIARTDDIVVLAGKGHETYQILNTGTIHLDEREVVAEALREMRAKE